MSKNNMHISPHENVRAVLDMHCQIYGVSRTHVIERAIIKYLGLMPVDVFKDPKWALEHIKHKANTETLRHREDPNGEE